MKNLIFSLLFIAVVLSCSGPQQIASSATDKKFSDTVRIANDALEYEVVIIEPGFNGWLQSTARPRGYYSESFLEGRNQLYVLEWNLRARQPQRFNPNLYEIEINYDAKTHYGYEVNYLIYNYFIYFQMKHQQQLGTFVVRP